jgi:hypothetical protein
MHDAALRPEEAADLRKWNLRLPPTGWGEIHLDQSAPDAGRDWTDDGSIRDQRALCIVGQGEADNTSVSTWLNAGGRFGLRLPSGRPQHSGALETYARSLDGREALARSRVEVTLRQSLPRGNFLN